MDKVCFGGSSMNDIADLGTILGGETHPCGSNIARNYPPDFLSLPLRPSSQTRSMFPGNQNLQKAATLGHLENQVSAALALRSAKEYRFWVLTYARYLVQEGE